MRDKTCGMLGGTITMGAVNFPGIFFAWGKQIISGIGWELVVKTLNEEGKHPPAPADLARLPIQHHVKINPSLYAMICDQEVVAAGVDVLLHSMLAGVKRVRNRWKLILCAKEGYLDVSSKVLVDCTGDANAVLQFFAPEIFALAIAFDDDQGNAFNVLVGGEATPAG